MLDKRTFGNSPAAIFLADRLNELDDHRQTHRVSSFINNTSKMLNEAVKMHIQNGMSTKMLYFIVDNISRDVANTAWDMQTGADGVVYDQTTCNLMANVLRGQVKSVKRRLEKVVRIHRQQARVQNSSAVKMVLNDKSTVIGQTEFVPRKITISSVADSNNEISLHARSVRRLKQRGIEREQINRFFKQK